MFGEGMPWDILFVMMIMGFILGLIRAKKK